MATGTEACFIILSCLIPTCYVSSVSSVHREKDSLFSSSGTKENDNKISRIPKSQISQIKSLI